MHNEGTTTWSIDLTPYIIPIILVFGTTSLFWFAATPVLSIIFFVGALLTMAVGALLIKTIEAADSSAIYQSIFLMVFASSLMVGYYFSGSLMFVFSRHS